MGGLSRNPHWWPYRFLNVVMVLLFERATTIIKKKTSGRDNTRNSVKALTKNCDKTNLLDLKHPNKPYYTANRYASSFFSPRLATSTPIMVCIARFWRGVHSLFRATLFRNIRERGVAVPWRRECTRRCWRGLQPTRGASQR